MASEAKAGWWARDTTPGYLLLATGALSFLLLNSAAAPMFTAFLDQPLALTLGPYELSKTVRGFTKDGLMAVFFLYVGLELKRESIEGPLRNLRSAALPILGAAGGMIMPALIYLLVATVLAPGASEAYVRGWAIPAATDIAFALGLLTLLGRRVPAGLRLFLLAVAIVDDLGAILIIAFFYSAEPNLAALGVSGALFLAMLALGQAGVRALTPFWLLGVALWLAMAQSGVSPTLAGVLTALAIPMRRPDGRAPLIAAEHALKPWVQLGVMPFFALVMAGAPLAGVTVEALFHPIALGIAAGLALGKPLGIAAFTLLGAALLRRPPPAGPARMIGLGLVAGVGFTMSLFIGALAFDDPVLQLEVRIGVIGGSAVAGALGIAILAWRLRAAERRDHALEAQEDLAEARGVLDRD